MAYEASYLGNHHPVIVKKYRQVIVHLRAIQGRDSINSWPGLKLEKLKGNKKGLYSVRLNEKWRIILEFRKIENKEAVVILNIEDYH